MPARGRVKFEEAFRGGADFLDEPLHVVVKTPAKFEGDIRIILDCLNVFLIGFRMKKYAASPPEDFLDAGGVFLGRDAFDSP